MRSSTRTVAGHRFGPGPSSSSCPPTHRRTPPPRCRPRRSPPARSRPSNRDATCSRPHPPATAPGSPIEVRCWPARPSGSARSCPPLGSAVPAARSTSGGETLPCLAPRCLPWPPAGGGRRDAGGVVRHAGAGHYPGQLAVSSVGAHRGHLGGPADSPAMNSATCWGAPASELSQNVATFALGTAAATVAHRR